MGGCSQQVTILHNTVPSALHDTRTNGIRRGHFELIWAHLPHLHRDWARPCHICTGTGLTRCHICTGTGSNRD
jgi:hypothetical protein